MHLYRIAQEAINNATKHGRAQNVALSLFIPRTGSQHCGLPMTVSEFRNLHWSKAGWV